MNGFVEPLPGLLDDPQFQLPNLPSLPDVHIAPLRNPAPSRHANAPLPLEPLTKSSEDHRHVARNNTTQTEEESEETSPLRLRPSDVLSAREAKKPHLAISELLEASNDGDTQYLPLPSFVSLAVVEKSPIQEPSLLSPHKRLRLDHETEGPYLDVGRRLPRPAQKDDKQPRRVPLLPAMVTGLHEPPPSAGMLPSMALDVRPKLPKTAKPSKMQLKDMLTEARQSTHVPPEAMLNTPDLPHAELSKPASDETQLANTDATGHVQDSSVAAPRKETKTRRTRRKWSTEETAHLMAGVKKHGFGKWKQILIDTAFVFHDRTSIDLKDRYRVFVKDQPENNSTTTRPNNHSQPDLSSLTIENTKAATDDVEVTLSKRKRRPWTSAEDAALMRGIAKHGFLWTAIHDDPELELSHRRATDLRDRIRNLYPEGYKQAEPRPLRSEVKKMDRSGQDHDPPTPEGDLKGTTKSARPSDDSAVVSRNNSKSTRRVTQAKAHRTGGDIQQTSEQAGVTLPSLALDDDAERDWGDNTLPPLLEWEGEDIGI